MTAASCHLRVLGLPLKPRGKGIHVSIDHVSYDCGTFLFVPGVFANEFMVENLVSDREISLGKQP